MKNEIITSRQNPSVKLLCSLDQKKCRTESRLFRFDGTKLCCEALMNDAEVVGIYVNAAKYPDVTEKVEAGLSDDSRVILLSEEVFDRVSDENSPEGIITVSKSLDKLHKIATIDNMGKFDGLPDTGETIILLEGVRDPGNLGTVIRSAAALGTDRMILTTDCADVYNPKTIRAAMGALFREKITFVSPELLAPYILSIRATGRRVFAAALRDDAVELGCFALKDGDCFVIGNEGHGLTEGVINACDRSVIIPMSAGNESLNAATAATVFIWETGKKH